MCGSKSQWREDGSCGNSPLKIAPSIVKFRRDLVKFFELEGSVLGSCMSERTAASVTRIHREKKYIRIQ